MLGFGVIAFFDYGLPLRKRSIECLGRFRRGFEKGHELEITGRDLRDGKNSREAKPGLSRAG